ncbi:C-Myc-binding protein [Canna indica]|uniref:c-Myc-binding protein n=1 Tax=Canna indica TaxID=4628 RepID=A0AAQ3QSC4_9LILI|nr:C-Myc-binding protein [Canna indica]
MDKPTTHQQRIHRKPEQVDRSKSSTLWAVREARQKGQETGDGERDGARAVSPLAFVWWGWGERAQREREEPKTRDWGHREAGKDTTSVVPRGGGIRSTPPADPPLLLFLDLELFSNPQPPLLIPKKNRVFFGWVWSGLMLQDMEREAKKEAFRKYLESSGVLDALTKVLVALYEENDKPSSAVEFVQQKLGGPSISDYEKLQAEKSDLQLKYDELLAAHRKTCRELEELRKLKLTTTDKENTDGENLQDG